MANKKTVELETKRLNLRKLKEEDYVEIYNTWTSSFEVSKYVEWTVHKNKEETKNLVHLWLNEYNNDYTYRWIVELKDTKKIIGMIDVVRKKLPYMTCEIGYAYGKDYWGKGYATEALTKIIKYLHEEGFIVVEACHMEKNIGSGKVMIKSGMKYDARLPKRIIDKDNIRQDILYYSSIKED